MARRPRELWSASYMFSYLMEQVLKAITGYGELLSPAVLNEEKDRKPVSVGLYPDRAFLKCNSDFQIMKVILEKAVSSFSEKTGLSEETVKSYFNIYATYVEESIDTDAIKKLNRQLDFLELNNLLFRIRNLRKSCHWLRKKSDSKLFQSGLGEKNMPVSMLAEIAAYPLRFKHKDSWEVIRELSAVRNEVRKQTAMKKEEDVFLKI